MRILFNESSAKKTTNSNHLGKEKYTHVLCADILTSLLMFWFWFWQCSRTLKTCTILGAILIISFTWLHRPPKSRWWWQTWWTPIHHLRLESWCNASRIHWSHWHRWGYLVRWISSSRWR